MVVGVELDLRGIKLAFVCPLLAQGCHAKTTLNLQDFNGVSLVLLHTRSADE